ncbi:MAG: ATP synthase F1 subunit epsilon [Deltaproteobacteria bacterium]|nr:ATP synthase F1 subunit epsilon [Deltaproteobacteria bacterium]
MSETLHVKVVTPTGSSLDEEVASFTTSSEMGEFCIMPNHRNIMASILPSRMLVEQVGGGTVAYALDSGFLEAASDHVNVITERCISAEDLDKSEITKEVAELEEKLAAMDSGASEAQEIIRALNWAKVRLAATG